MQTVFAAGPLRFFSRRKAPLPYKVRRRNAFRRFCIFFRADRKSEDVNADCFCSRSASLFLSPKSASAVQSTATKRFSTILHLFPRRPKKRRCKCRLFFAAGPLRFFSRRKAPLPYKVRRRNAFRRFCIFFRADRKSEDVNADGSFLQTKRLRHTIETWYAGAFFGFAWVLHPFYTGMHAGFTVFRYTAW